MNRSTPGVPVYHQLPESTQTHVHWVSDAIQASHPLSSLSLFFSDSSKVCPLSVFSGNPLQYSCLENPVDRGAWWAAVHRVTQSRTRLKQLSSSSSTYAYVYHWLIQQILVYTCHVPSSVQGRTTATTAMNRTVCLLKIFQLTGKW